MKFSYQDIEYMYTKMINNPLPAIVIVLVLLLIGVFFLWARGYFGEAGKQSAQKKTNKKIKESLIYEINKNIELLKDFWGEYQIIFPASDESLSIESTQRFYDGSDVPKPIEYTITNPKFKDDIFKKYRFSALLSEKNLKKVEEFYSKLDSITHIYEKSKKLGESDDEITSLYENRERLKSLITEVLKQGNLLEK